MGIVTLNRKLKPFIEPMRYKVAYGGRGSAKSWTIARLLLLKASEQKIDVVCTREIQNSMRDSVHKLLKTQIDLLELSGFTTQNDKIIHSNGSSFVFRGLYTNLSNLKGFENADICWIEEAESISDASWEILEPTIRKPGSEFWISFNPRYETDVMYRCFIVDPPPNAYVIKVNYQDNKFFTTELKDQMERMRERDPDLYFHIWEGELKKNTQEQIFANCWSISDFEIDSDHFYFGADWGFSQDPNTLNRCLIRKNTLYIDYEVNDRPYDNDTAKTSTDLKQLPALWDRMPLVRTHIVQADSARPETISYMKSEKFKVKSVKKWSGSVEDGIEFIRSFDNIVVHSRCVNTIWEFKNYKYKVDARSGQITNKIIDEFNHHIDAIRYALTPLITNRNNFKPTTSKPPPAKKRTI